MLIYRINQDCIAVYIIKNYKNAGMRMEEN